MVYNMISSLSELPTLDEFEPSFGGGELRVSGRAAEDKATDDEV